MNGSREEGEEKLNLGEVMHALNCRKFRQLRGKQRQMGTPVEERKCQNRGREEKCGGDGVWKETRSQVRGKKQERTHQQRGQK